jgi:hypothetical protein
LVASQGVVADDAFYFLASPSGPSGADQYTEVVRAQVGS